MLLDGLPAPLIVAPAGNDELHLVTLGQGLDIRPVVFFALAAVRALEIHDLDGRGRQCFDRQAPAGLDEHGTPFIEKRLREIGAFRLRERFPARDLHESTIQRAALFHNVLHGNFFAAVEGVGRIAPHAPERASRQPNEDTREACPGGFALDAFVDLGNAHSLLRGIG